MEPTCEGCASDPDAFPDLTPWAAHLLQLSSMVEAGCRFLIDDLTPEEWKGLIIISQEKNLAIARIQNQPRPESGD